MKNKNKNTLLRTLCSPVAASAKVAVAASMLTLACLATAQAQQFGVRVINDSGMPVSGASVCVGLPGNYKQFGALFTDKDGMARMDVPNIPVVVTISKTRFSGIRMSEPARDFTLIKEVTLSEGRPGPRCKAGSSLAGESSITVANVDVLAADNQQTTLEVRVAGREPSHYRVSHSAEFTDANWQSFDNTIQLSRSLSRQRQVFLQMRRLEGSSKSWVEARSDVVEVRLPGVR